MVLGTRFYGCEKNLEKSGAKDLRGMTSSIPLCGLLILKSKSDNLMTSINEFIANSFRCNIQSFACLIISYPSAILIFAKSIQLSKTSSSPIFRNKQPTWIRRYRLNMLNQKVQIKYFEFTDNMNSLWWLWWWLHSLIFSLPNYSTAEVQILWWDVESSGYLVHLKEGW